MHPKDIQIEQFTYELPEDRIAQHPLDRRDASKLLVFRNGEITDEVFSSIPDSLPEESLLVFNETKVIRARLISPRGEGMRPIEIFCLDPLNKDIESSMSATGEVSYICLVGNAKKWKDQVLTWKDPSGRPLLHAEKLGRDGANFHIRFFWEGPLHFAAILEELGHIPLPPYMHRSEEPEDVNRYQTVYATRDGSVAAPTAGLHFTNKVLQRIEEKGIELGRVILHVGAGTFKPVSADRMEDHDMHSEAFEVSTNLLRSILQSPNVTAVGTTSTRTLESLYWLGLKALNGEELDFHQLFVDQWEPYTHTDFPSSQDALSALLKSATEAGITTLRGRTQIIIAPGYTFRVISQLITNFHQPGSTLILLVAAALGDQWKDVYQHALTNDYRFLSYGDSSLLYLS
ncbi:MAG: S-adenosylmethionine:tRNA ribosyltransferase-isomerase [Bacteroidetes bacterium]|nr:MAG: S-adenosylmethionine:tRNA ribosyltransferase-isomerase [Bacteroidota bacterium]